MKNPHLLKESLAWLGLVLDAMLIFGVVDIARGSVRGLWLVGLYFSLGYLSTKLWIRFFETVNGN